MFAVTNRSPHFGQRQSGRFLAGVDATRLFASRFISIAEEFTSRLERCPEIGVTNSPGERRRWQIPAGCPTVISPDSGDLNEH